MRLTLLPISNQLVIFCCNHPSELYTQANITNLFCDIVLMRPRLHQRMSTIVSTSKQYSLPTYNQPQTRSLSGSIMMIDRFEKQSGKRLNNDAKLLELVN